jgi:hypothetical protein
LVDFNSKIQNNLRKRKIEYRYNRNFGPAKLIPVLGTACKKTGKQMQSRRVNVRSGGLEEVLTGNFHEVWRTSLPCRELVLKHNNFERQKYLEQFSFRDI